MSGIECTCLACERKRERGEMPDGVRVSCAVLAVSAVFQYYAADFTVTVERYPARRDFMGWYTGSNTYDKPRVFAFQFFNAAGRNVASYLPDLGSVHYYGPEGRVWGWPRGETMDIEQVKAYR